MKTCPHKDRPMYRVNEKGAPGVFKCMECIRKCQEKEPDQDTQDLMNILAKARNETYGE